MYDALMTNYRGCNNGYAFWGTTTYGNVWNPRSATSLGRRYVPFNGVIVRSSYYVKKGTLGANPNDIKELGYPKVSFKNITDGTSNTAMLSEKRLQVSRFFLNAWYDDRGWSDGWDPDTMRLTICPPSPDGEVSLGSSNRDGFTAGSSHPSTFHVAFVDSSVRSMSYDIDTEIFNQLAHRSDGQSLDSSAY